jgi:hypothetical protein
VKISLRSEGGSGIEGGRFLKLKFNLDFKTIDSFYNRIYLAIEK